MIWDLAPGFSRCAEEVAERSVRVGLVLALIALSRTVWRLWLRAAACVSHDPRSSYLVGGTHVMEFVGVSSPGRLRGLIKRVFLGWERSRAVRAITLTKCASISSTLSAKLHRTVHNSATMDVDCPIVSLKRSSSAPMINEISATMSITSPSTSAPRYTFVSSKKTKQKNHPNLQTTWSSTNHKSWCQMDIKNNFSQFLILCFLCLNYFLLFLLSTNNENMSGYMSHDHSCGICLECFSKSVCRLEHVWLQPEKHRWFSFLIARVAVFQLVYLTCYWICFVQLAKWLKFVSNNMDL